MKSYPRLSYSEWRAAALKGAAPDAIISKGYVAGVEGMPERQVKFTVSTGALDRDNDRVSVDGWVLDPYRENPVVLWAHDDHQPPVGKSVKTWTQAGALKSVCQFTTAEENPFGAQVHALVKGGFLKGTSVGFHPIDFAEATQRKGIDFTKQELYEYSIIPIPSNREALVEAKAAGLVVAPVVEWCREFIESNDGGAGLWLPKEIVEGVLKSAVLKVSPKSIRVPGIGKAAPAAPPQAPVPAAGHAATGAAQPPQPQSAAAQMAGMPPQNRYLTIPDDLAKPMLVQEVLSEQAKVQPPVPGTGNPVWAMLDSLRSIAEFGGDEQQMQALVEQDFAQFEQAMETYMADEAAEGEQGGEADMNEGDEGNEPGEVNKDDAAQKDDTQAAGKKEPPFPPKPGASAKPGQKPKPKNPFAKPKGALGEMAARARARREYWEPRVKSLEAQYPEGFPIDFIAKACPECAEKLKAKGITRIRMKAGDDAWPEASSAALCDKWGSGDGFSFTKCANSSLADSIDNVEAFCASLHKHCTGLWPTEKPKGAESIVVKGSIRRAGDKWEILDHAGKVVGNSDSEEKARASLRAREAGKHNPDWKGAQTEGARAVDALFDFISKGEPVTFAEGVLDDVQKNLPPMKACPECGMKVKVGADKCPHCGHSMGGTDKAADTFTIGGVTVTKEEIERSVKATIKEAMETETRRITGRLPD